MVRNFCIAILCGAPMLWAQGTADRQLEAAIYREVVAGDLKGAIEQYRAIAAWEKTTATGDRAELAELPETSPLWHKLDARADACSGQKCSEWERCFVTEMRRRGICLAGKLLVVFGI